MTEVRLVAVVALALVAVALATVQWKAPVLYRFSPMLDPFGAERDAGLRRRQALGWGFLVLGMMAGAIAILTIPPNTAAATVFQGAMLVVAAGGAVRVGRRNRRNGVKAPRPMGHHGPPGWEWDGDAVTWRRP